MLPETLTLTGLFSAELGLRATPIEPAGSAAVKLAVFLALAVP